MRVARVLDFSLILRHVLLGSNINLSKRLVKLGGPKTVFCCCTLFFAPKPGQPLRTSLKNSKKRRAKHSLSGIARLPLGTFVQFSLSGPLGTLLGVAWVTFGVPLWLLWGLWGSSWASLGHPRGWAPLGLLGCLLGLCWAPLGVLGVSPGVLVACLWG